MNIPKLRNTKHRIKISEDGLDATWIPEKYLTAQWKRIKSPDLFLKIWGPSMTIIARQLNRYLCFVHESDAYFTQGAKFQKMKSDLIDEYGDALSLQFFKNGIAEDKVINLTIYDIASTIFQLTKHKVSFNLSDATYTINKKAILTAEEYKEWSKDDLKEEAIHFQLSSKSGTKEEIINRLILANKK